MNGSLNESGENAKFPASDILIEIDFSTIYNCVCLLAVRTKRILNILVRKFVGLMAIDKLVTFWFNLKTD